MNLCTKHVVLPECWWLQFDCSISYCVSVVLVLQNHFGLVLVLVLNFKSRVLVLEVDRL